MISVLRKIVPASWISAYHLVLAHAAANWYGHPSRDLIVVGVTGTKGKTTTSILITRLLELSGVRVGLTSTVLLKIADREIPNPWKMTMPGRFALQRALRDMKDAGCRIAVVETSSEGILQHRHVGIHYDYAVFTNLSPEHIERHGSYQAYRTAKGGLFQSLMAHPQTVMDDEGIRRVAIVNGDDLEAEFFLGFSADEKIAFGFDAHKLHQIHARYPGLHAILGTKLIIDASGSSFIINEKEFRTPLQGRMNAENTLAAVAATLAIGFRVEQIQAALPQIALVPGRMERVDAGQPFTVIVDYAHEPKSFQAIFDTVALLQPKKAIAVFGCVGGGRDVSHRVEMGRIAAHHAQHIILTADDPYEDDPVEIARDIEKGFEGVAVGQYEIIADRREAIKKALSLARPGDLVLILGKGGDTMMKIGGKTIPWDDRGVVIEEIKAESLTHRERSEAIS